MFLYEFINNPKFIFVLNVLTYLPLHHLLNSHLFTILTMHPLFSHLYINAILRFCVLYSGIYCFLLCNNVKLNYLRMLKGFSNIFFKAGNKLCRGCHHELENIDQIYFSLALTNRCRTPSSCLTAMHINGKTMQVWKIFHCKSKPNILQHIFYIKTKECLLKYHGWTTHVHIFCLILLTGFMNKLIHLYSGRLAPPNPPVPPTVLIKYVLLLLKNRRICSQTLRQTDPQRDKYINRCTPIQGLLIGWQRDEDRIARR